MRLRFADHQRAGGSQLADGEAILPGMENRRRLSSSRSSGRSIVKNILHLHAIGMPVERPKCVAIFPTPVDIDGLRHQGGRGYCARRKH